MLRHPQLPATLLSFMLTGCATNQVVSYQSDVDPILQEKCRRCHIPPDGSGYVSTGLSMESYDSLMRGTMFGKVIIPGDSKRSVLNKLTEGRAGESMRMPHGAAEPLTPEQIDVLKHWVDQGALYN
jgi:uncharacterized membrane protein